MFKAMGDKWALDEIKEPIILSDRARCEFTALDPSKRKIFYATTLIFDKNTYILQVSSPDYAKAKEILVQSEKSFAILTE
jgi:hypothetical protein